MREGEGSKQRSHSYNFDIACAAVTMHHQDSFVRIVAQGVGHQSGNLQSSDIPSTMMLHSRSPGANICESQVRLHFPNAVESLSRVLSRDRWRYDHVLAIFPVDRCSYAFPVSRLKRIDDTQDFRRVTATASRIHLLVWLEEHFRAYQRD